MINVFQSGFHLALFAIEDESNEAHRTKVDGINDPKAESLQRDAELLAAQRVEEKVDRVRGEVQVDEHLVECVFDVRVDVVFCYEHAYVGEEPGRSVGRVQQNECERNEQKGLRDAPRRRRLMRRRRRSTQRGSRSRGDPKSTAALGQVAVGEFYMVVAVCCVVCF